MILTTLVILLLFATTLRASAGRSDPGSFEAPLVDWQALYLSEHQRSERLLHKAHRYELQRNALRRSVRQIRRASRASSSYGVGYAIRLASAVTGVSASKMRSVAYCESRFDPYASNGRYKGLFQLGWSPFGFSPYDPIANALSAALTVQHDGSWRQWECG